MRPGQKCPHCKSVIKYTEQTIDSDGNLICSVCTAIIFPATEEAEKSLLPLLPVNEYNYSQAKEYILYPVT